MATQEAQPELDGEQIQTVFTKLDSWILDENKLVTYKWLSRMVRVNVNLSKLLLLKYIELHGTKPLPDVVLQKNSKALMGMEIKVVRALDKQEKCEFSVTYCVAGVKKSTEAFALEIVREEDLETRLDIFIEPVSCHIFSIQKGKACIGSHTLYIADCDLTKETLLKSNVFSAIVCDKAILCSVEELKQEIKTVAQEHSTDSSKVGNTSNSKQADKSKNNFFGNVKSEKSSNSATSTAASKTEDKSVRPSDEKPVKNFFGNAAAKQKPKQSSVSGNNEEKDSSSKITHPDKPSLNSNTKSKDTNSGKISDKSKENNCTRLSAPETKASTNKRRRVIDSSSSSEDENESDTEEMELDRMNIEDCNSENIPVTDGSQDQENSESTKTDNGDKTAASAPQNSASMVAQGPLSQSNRILVSKTYMNEEGFMVTDKVWEMVTVPKSDPVVSGATTAVTNSDSGDKNLVVVEAQVAAKKGSTGNTAAVPVKTVKKSAKASATSGKQQTNMMAFFKKQ